MTVIPILATPSPAPDIFPQIGITSPPFQNYFVSILLIELCARKIKKNILVDGYNPGCQIASIWSEKRELAWETRGGKKKKINFGPSAVTQHMY